MLLLFHKERDVGVSHFLSFRIQNHQNFTVPTDKLEWHWEEGYARVSSRIGISTLTFNDIHTFQKFQISSQSPVHVAVSVAADRTTTKLCLRMHFEHETSGNLSVPTWPAIFGRSNARRLNQKKKMPSCLLCISPSFCKSFQMVPAQIPLFCHLCVQQLAICKTL